MTEAPTKRSKLKQARLGAIQKKVLVVLLGMQMQRQRTGEPFTGLPFREIQARIYTQVILGDSQWLQSVYARMLMEQGRVVEANELLTHGTELLASILHRRATASLLPDKPLPAEFRFVFEQLQEKADRIRNTLFLLRHAPTGTDPEGIHSMLLSLATEASSSISVDPYIPPYSKDGYSTLTSEEKTAAEKTVTVQQASLSRALRVLEDHGLIEEQDVVFNQFGNRERRIYITPLGVQRLNSEARKIAEKQ